MGLFGELFKELVIDKAIDHHNKKKAEKIEQYHHQQSEPKKQAREAERARQLQALRSAVPKSPPERIRSTIQINEIKWPRYQSKKIYNTFGEDSSIYVETGEDIKYAVDMILELPEADLALIKQYQIDDIILEDTPLYNENDLAEFRARDQEDIEGTKDPLLKEIKRQVAQDVRSLSKHERRTTRLGALLVHPFSRVFDSLNEAKDYSDTLKTKHIPTIKAQIQRYREHKGTETTEY